MKNWLRAGKPKLLDGSSSSKHGNRLGCPRCWKKMENAKRSNLEWSHRLTSTSLPRPMADLRQHVPLTPRFDHLLRYEEASSGTSNHTLT